MIYNNLCHTIRTSKNQYYKYYLNSLNALVEENFKDSSLFSKTNILYTDILDYSIEIDSNDILNIIHINSNGELYYSLFSPEKNSKKLAQIDLNNFTIKFLTLKLINNSPHIFYVIRKNTSTNWYLYHNYYYNGDWFSDEVTSIQAKKYISPYLIDCVNDELYIFSRRDNLGNYIIKKFNLKFKGWEDIDTLYLPQCFNISFFMNKSGTALIYFNSFNNHNILTYLIYKGLKQQKTAWSQPLLLSDPIKNSIKPSITFNGQFIYVLWEYENNIEYLSTDMSGTKILNRNIFTKSAEKDTFKSIYLSSHPYDTGNKSNYSILSATDNPVFILDIKNKQTKETKNYAVIDDTKKNTNFLLSSSIRHMQLVLIEKDKKLMQIIGNYAKLKNGINTIIDGKAKSLLNNKIFVPDTNKTEDELMLGKLNYIINSLSNEIYIRDEKINELNTQINKQLFKKLFH